MTTEFKDFIARHHPDPDSLAADADKWEWMYNYFRDKIHDMQPLLKKKDAISNPRKEGNPWASSDWVDMY
jgi:hypothetical protein